MEYYDKTISKMKEIQKDLNNTSKLLAIAFNLYCFLLGFMFAIVLNLVTS